MVAVDSSTLIAYIQGDGAEDVELFDRALATGQAVIAPVVLTEILSEPKLPPGHRRMVLSLPVLDLLPGYWTRAAATRATVLSKRLRARLPDALIAQSCIDHDVALIARDGDFRHFARYCGLKLA
ncbi:MAG: PIN domain-containing protein [Bauldia sp.]